MKHLTTEEKILFNGKWGLSSDQRENIKNHLLTCQECSDQISKLKLQQNVMTKANNKGCQEFNQYLLSLIDGELEGAKKLLVEEHLEKCYRCLAIYESLSDLQAWETDSEFVAEKSKEKIETTVLNALKKKEAKQFITEKKEKIKRSVEEFIYEITLVFHPLRPEVVFRGDDTKDLKVIEHPGGDLQINTGIENIDVQLTSIFEEFTVKAKTNKDGIAIFKSLKKGDYVSQVNGYQLDEIKIKK